jgi:DNA-binding MarR family transcriptional regulator
MQLNERIGRRIKLQDLHVLMTVIQAGSMGKAAERLNISQPAISRSIAELEHALGVRLFDRHRRGIEATEYGRALLDCGVAVFDDLRQGGMDCCDGFLEYGRRDAQAAGVANVTFVEGDVQSIRSNQSMISAFRVSERNSSRIRWQACATCAQASSPAAP